MAEATAVKGPSDRGARPGASPRLVCGVLVGLLGLSAIDRFGRLVVVAGAQFTYYQFALVASLLWLAWAVRTRRIRLRWLAFIPWAALLLAAAAVTIPWAFSPRTALVQFTSLVFAVGLGCLAGWIADSPERIETTLAGILGLSSVLSVLALLEAARVFAFQTPVFWSDMIRPRVLYNDPNILGGLLAAAAISAVPLALASRSRARTTVLLAGALLCGVGAATTQSRGALAGLVVAAVLVLAFAPVPRRTRVLAGLGALAASVALLLFLGPQWVQQRVLGIWADPSWTTRLDLITGGLRLFVQRPFGIGPGNFPLVIERVIGSVTMGTIESHNTLVTVLAEDGMLGAIGTVGVALATFPAALRARTSRVHPAALAAAAGATVFLVQSLVYSMETSKPFWVFLGPCAGAIVAERGQRRHDRGGPAKVCIVQYNSSRFLARVDRAARALAESGLEVVLIAIKDGETPAFERRDGYVVRRVVLSTRRLPRWTRPLRFVEAVWKTLVAALRERADVYDARDIYPLLVTWFAARVNDAVFVYDSDELNLYRNWPWTGRWWWRLFARAYEGFFVRRADAVITSDPGRADILAGLYGGPRPLVVRNVANVVERPEPDAAFRERSLKGRSRLLLYAGGLVANRGLEQLVDAMEALPDCALVIVGAGHLSDALARRVEERGLSDRVDVLPAVPLDDLMRMTAAADAAVMPIVGSCLSYVHAVPQKLYEAMMVGVPVVASDLPDMADVVRAERIGTLIADPTDPASIAEAVRSLFALGDAELARMREHARASALESYNWELEKALLVGEYERLGVLPTSGSRPLRIAMVLSNGCAPDPRVEKEAAALGAAGHDVVILAWDRDGGLPPAESRDGFRIERTGPRARYGGGLRSLPRFAGFWREATARLVSLGPDVVHCHDADTLVVGLRLLRLRPGTRLVIDFHEIYSLSAMVPQRGAVALVARVIVDALERRAIRRSAAVIVAPPGAVEHYRRLGAGDRMTVVMNAPEADLFVPMDRAGREMPFTVCFVGRLRYLSTLLALMDAVGSVSGTRAVIAGGGPREGDVRQAAIGRDRVEVRSAVPYREVPGLYARSDVVFAGYDALVGNVVIGTPGKLLEAMGCGKAVIVSAGTWAGDFVERERLGLAVDCGDAAAVAAALRRLRDDPKETLAMGGRGRALVEREYNWSAASRALVGVYDRLARA